MKRNFPSAMMPEDVTGRPWILLRYCHGFVNDLLMSMRSGENRESRSQPFLGDSTSSMILALKFSWAEKLS